MVRQANQKVQTVKTSTLRKEKKTMKNAASKMMWVARATVFMVGLAVTLALVLGVATTALGATGASFILGKPNSATTTTSLVSTLSKATKSALSVTNKSGGPALSLGVLSGKAPIRVSATAGTATNLSADKLDGKDSSEFLGRTEKAADSDTLDGLDSIALQRRVSTACDPGSSIRAISEDGTPTCEIDDDTSATQVNALKTELGTNDNAPNEPSDPVSYSKVKDIPTNIVSRDADTLDGKDSAAFLGATQKAADSDRLDGKDSSDFAAAYKRTVVVSPMGTDLAYNGQVLLDALNGITDASESKPYLIYLEPGTYLLGSRTLHMTPYVDIQGAGLNTMILGSSNSSGSCDAAVAGASNAELSSLMVRKQANGCSFGIISNSTVNFRLTNVTVVSAVGGFITDFSPSTAVYNLGSSPTMTNVTAIASGGSTNYGVRNDSSSPTMTNVTTDVRGTNSFGVHNLSSSPTIKQSTLRGDTNSLYQKGGTSNVALTQLVGAVSRPSGTLQCFNNYDQNMAPVTCP